jgi:hypothetical protein
MGDRPNDKYAGCYWKVYLHFVAWEGVREDTKKNYFACLRKILQKALRKKM